MYLKQLRQAWNNLSFRNKLSLLLVGGAILPTLFATQGIVSVAEIKFVQNFKGKLRSQLNTLEINLADAKKDIAVEAETLASFVGSQGGVLTDSQQIEALRNLLSSYVRRNADRSFYLIADTRGRTVAQYIQVVKDNFSTYPLLDENKLTKTEFIPVSLPTGINLEDIPIVKDALTSQRSLSGVELLKNEWLRRLGLDKQANIGIREQKTDGLPEAKQPFAVGTYDIDNGKAGLAIVAVHPIEVGGKLVGTAIVGTLLNRNYGIVDRLKQEFGVPTATIFARDWRVTTNVPYTDERTRAIGTRVSREVATKVLNQKEAFLGSANIIGIDYFTGYSPIYDHQKEINSTTAQPVGIAYVGEPQTELQNILTMLRLVGLAFGGVIAILAGVIAVPIAETISKPLHRLANSAKKVGAGDLTTPVPIADTQDEIGTLLASFQNMAENLNSLIHQVQESAVQITVAAGEIAASGNQLEATMSQQVASTDRVTATAKQIVVTSENLVKTMDEVGNNSQTTAKAAGDSKKDLMQMESTMFELVEATDNISTKLGAIKEKAININGIVTTIAKVADQTNLLSLNAAIEAEKAGQYGAGFAVVAREIRRLADQTAVAALEIENMVKQMQAAVSSGVSEMDKFTGQVKRSVVVVQDIGTKLEAIIQQVQALTPRFQAVSNSVNTQSQGAEQISTAMVQLSQASSETANSLSEINGSIGQLKDAAQSLRQEISRFKVARK